MVYVLYAQKVGYTTIPKQNTCFLAGGAHPRVLRQQQAPQHGQDRRLSHRDGQPAAGHPQGRLARVD